MRGYLVGACIAGAGLLVAQTGCAPFFRRAAPRQELLLIATVRVLKPEEANDKTPNQATVMIRIVEVSKAFADRLPVRWQPLTVPEQRSRVLEQPPASWAESSTVGWAETVQRRSARAEWTLVEQSHYGEIARAIRANRDANLITAPRLTVFSDRMAQIGCLTRRGFTRPDDPPGPPEQQVGRLMLHIKNQHVARLYLDLVCGKGLAWDRADFVEAVLSPQAPPDPSFVYTDDPAHCQIDLNRVSIVADVPDGGTLIIRCPGFIGQGK